MQQKDEIKQKVCAMVCKSGQCRPRSPKLWAAMVANTVERYGRLEIVEKMSGVGVQVAAGV